MIELLFGVHAAVSLMVLAAFAVLKAMCDAD